MGAVFQIDSSVVNVNVSIPFVENASLGCRDYSAIFRALVENDVVPFFDVTVILVRLILLMADSERNVHLCLRVSH